MRKAYPVTLIVLAFVVGLIAYGRMPEQVPVHWNIRGEVDRLGSRAEAAFAMPVTALLIWATLRFLPRIDPRRANYARFQDTYDFVVNVVLTMIVGIDILVLATALGAPISLARVIPVAMGFLVILIGNRLPLARPNWWFGIRTPWTLTNDRVWERTHRIGGYVMIGIGVLMIAAALLPAPWTMQALWITGAAGVLFVVAYSYFAWRDETARQP